MKAETEPDRRQQPVLIGGQTGKASPGPPRRIGKGKVGVVTKNRDERLDDGAK